MYVSFNTLSLVLCCKIEWSQKSHHNELEACICTYMHTHLYFYTFYHEKHHSEKQTLQT